MDYILTIVKFTSLTLAAGFAILGTTVDYKKEGQVTKWGRIAIIGVIASGLLSTILLGLEESKKAEEREKTDRERIEAQNNAEQEKKDLYDKFNTLFENTKENIDKTTETLKQTREVAKDVKDSVETQKDLVAQTKSISGGVKKNLESQNRLLNQSEKISTGVSESLITQNKISSNTLRALLPFRRNQLAVLYTLKYGLQRPELQAYKSRIENIINTEFSDEFGTPFENRTITIIRNQETKKLEQLRIRPGSLFFPPNNSVDRAPYDWASFPMITMHVFKQRLTSQEVAEIDREKSDLQVEVMTIPSVRDVIDYSVSPYFFQDYEKNKDIFFKVELTFNYEPEQEGFYISVLTNNFSFWQDDKGLISGINDLQNSSLIVDLPTSYDERDVPRVFPELSSITFFTGEKYDRKFSLPAENKSFKTIRDFAYYYVDESDIVIR